MARKKETPLRFMLPDGDNVDLITWEYVESMLEAKLGDMIIALEDQNVDLNRIDAKITSWITT